jgi:pilus assembly protein CpaF
MAGSDKDAKDDLLGIFSARGTQTRIGALKPPVSKSAASPAEAEPQSKTNASPANPGALPVVQKQPEATQSVVDKSRVPPRAAVNRQTELSPTGSIVMREVRRELGSDLSLQQQMNNPAMTEKVIASAVDKVLKKRGESIDDIERANIIISLQKDLVGWGVLQPLIDNKEVTDIHVYDYKSVVLQRGKVSELTGLSWPNHQAYVTFLDRLLLRLGKSLTTAQHTVDGSFPNGTRLCAVHESVCGQRGPLLCIRVPRMSEVALENIVTYQVAPPLIVNYLACLIRSGLATMMVAGETGTGKTTLIKCLATQFGPDESIVAVEDTPELNFAHPYFRSLVSRAANAEGMGEVTLQEHIKTTLRMTPTRVILGEMRTPFAAEAFLESAQTGHVGMSTIHARNARETLVRLESLLGRAQKSVAIDIIRQQIALAVDSVVWLIREKSTGKPRIAEVIEVGHFVEGSIQIRPMFTLIKQGQRPVWRVDSWTSNFDEQLKADGIHLGDSPQEISFAPPGRPGAPTGGGKS